MKPGGGPCSSPSKFLSRAATLTPSSSPWVSTPGNPLLPWPTTPPPPPQDPKSPENPNEDLDLPARIAAVLRSARPPPFSAAWDLLLSSPSPPSLPSYLPLIRRYARAHLPSSALRTLSFYLSRADEGRGAAAAAAGEHPEPFELLLDALVKEGLTKHASAYFLRKKSAQPGWAPSVRCYNILLHGWFRSRNLARAEKLWAEMGRDGVEPSVVTYGTLVEGLCRMRRPDRAMELLEEMRSGRGEMGANHLVLNPIVDALAEAGRFREALGFVERFPAFGVSPNVSTYNSLVKGFVKSGDVAGGSRILKAMIGREILPTATTYNYFFRYFAKFGKIEEGMNLYDKMVRSGYEPDRLTYQLLIKMLCENQRLDLAVQMIKEMNQNGFDSDLATSTMLIHLLARLRRYDEAVDEFEGMIKRGIVPQYITYRMLVKELKRLGMDEMERKVSKLMDSVPHSTKLPRSYREREGDEVVSLRKSIIKKAGVISETLKVYKDTKEMNKVKESGESVVESANRLIADIKRRVYAVKSE